MILWKKKTKTHGILRTNIFCFFFLLNFLIFSYQVLQVQSFSCCRDKVEKKHEFNSAAISLLKLYHFNIWTIHPVCCRNSMGLNLIFRTEISKYRNWYHVTSKLRDFLLKMVHALFIFNTQMIWWKTEN